MNDRPITPAELDAAVREALAQVFMELAQQLGADPEAARIERQWLDTNQAYKSLGLQSAKALRDLVTSGDLRLGQEVRDRRRKSSTVPRYQFHIEKCQARLTQLPEKRR